MRKIKTAALVIAAIVMAVVIVVGCALVAIVNPDMFQQSGTTQQETEDCDAEDLLNREDDCGFVSPKPAKTAAPKVTPALKSSPRTGATRR